MSLRSSADILLGSWAMLPGMMVMMTTRARPLVIMVRDVLPLGGALVKCLLRPVIKREDPWLEATSEQEIDGEQLRIC